MAELNISDLDFNSIKSNFIEYMESQDEFNDYDFEGSALNTLMDLLAYNTYQNSFYLNMVANEMFLDTSTTREATVSIAKHLGYVPNSISSSSAEVNINVSIPYTGSDTVSSISIPKYTKFTATQNNISYDFIASDIYSSASYTDANNIRTFTLENVSLVEGSLYEFNYIVNINEEEQRFVIPATNVDTTHLSVTVATSYANPNEIYTYSKAGPIIDLTGSSLVYFLQEVEEGKFEIYFGDGVLGKELINGNLIMIKYIVTNGSVANSIGSTDSTSNPSFLLADTIPSSTSMAFFIVTISISFLSILL